MARFEITENIGPEVINSWSGPLSGQLIENYGEVIDVRHYTIHSYQLINKSSNDIGFNIYVSNYINSDRSYSNNFNQDWAVLHAATVPANSNLAYCDIWNFRYAVIYLNGPDGSNVDVFEKHNV